MRVGAGLDVRVAVAWEVIITALDVITDILTTEHPQQGVAGCAFLLILGDREPIPILYRDDSQAVVNRVESKYQGLILPSFMLFRSYRI